jgi:hypothetical protein
VLCVLVLISQAIPAVVIVSTGEEAAAVSGHLATAPGGPLVRLLATGLPVLAATPFWLAWVIHQVACFRRAAGEVRQQFKWFTAGAAVSLAGIVVLTVAESGSGTGLATVVNAVAVYSCVALPVGMGVAILRYRLYDIDRIISRTVSYAIVTGLLVGVYAGLVVLATQALPVTLSTPVAVAVATLAAVALFNPLRRRVQKLVDRRFNRARYNADQAVAAFAARLTGAAELDAVRADLLIAVERALEPAQVSVWMPGGGQ